MRKKWIILNTQKYNFVINRHTHTHTNTQGHNFLRLKTGMFIILGTSSEYWGNLISIL